MRDAAPTPPKRRAVWAVRLVFYPVALALIALAWHQRQAGADDADGGSAPGVAVTYSGRTTQRGPHHGVTVVRDGGGTRLAVVVAFRCAPEVGPVWATFRQHGEGTFSIDHGPVDWASGWHGRADGVIRLRLAGEGRATGSVRLRMVVLTAAGRITRCHSGALRFVASGRVPARR